MAVKLILWMTFAIGANCQSTISSRNDAILYGYELSVDIKSEMGSIRQLLMKQQQEMKSEIDEIRQIVIQQHGNETQGLQEMRLEMEEIRQIVIQQQYWSRNEQRKTECPVGFDYLPEAGSCFMFVFTGMTWDDATERCRGIMPGVHLATITSQQEDDAIAIYLQSQFSKNGIGSPRLPYVTQWSHGVWTSGHRKNPRGCDDLFIWKPLNGIEIPFNFTNWTTDEPNCKHGQENEPCVNLVPYLGHTWNDARCSTLFYPLCEI